MRRSILFVILGSGKRQAKDFLIKKSHIALVADLKLFILSLPWALFDIKDGFRKMVRHFIGEMFRIFRVIVEQIVFEG